MRKNLDYPDNLINDIGIDLDSNYNIDDVLLTALNNENKIICPTVDKERLRNVIIQRYKYKKSYAIIAKDYNLTSERIRILTIKGLKILRRYLEIEEVKRITNVKEAITVNKKEININDIKLVFNNNIRIRNALIRFGINSIQDLCKFSEEEIRRIGNIGNKSFAEIIRVMEERGLKLKEKNTSIDFIFNHDPIIYDTLARNKIRHIEDLCDYTKEEVANFGDRGFRIDRVERVLKENGLKFKES